MSPGPLVIRWHNDIGDLSPPAIIPDQAVNSCQGKQTESRVHKQVPSPSGLIYPDQAPSSHISRSERDLSLGWYWASLAARVISVKCDHPMLWSVPRVWSHSDTPGATHKWTLLAGREPKCLFDAYCICLEITIGELHTNTICIKFTSNNGSSRVIFGYFWISNSTFFDFEVSL